ncbi:hypothetical protein OOK27_23975 [Streptomyces canus]|uniref:hypothetical protein n=1 Tax=Streptomyces canus TaxID=58343 RepID=UPI0022567FB2|nr:hypothetical protein [Streptomyces canus]MCX5257142.1 hypothetical protein [Streptomyces canus]
MAFTSPQAPRTNKPHLILTQVAAHGREPARVTCGPGRRGPGGVLRPAASLSVRSPSTAGASPSPRNATRRFSTASCTTNCIAPTVKVLHKAFGIDRGVMTDLRLVRQRGGLHQPAPDLTALVADD